MRRHFVAYLDGLRTGVRCHHHIVEAGKLGNGIVAVFEDIETGSPYHPGAQRLGQSLLVDQWSPRGVDENGGGLHLTQGLGIDEMIGIGIAWAGILAMPYSILSRSVNASDMGAYMGIFNFTITIPQIVIGLTGGLIVKWVFGSQAIYMLGLAGVFMLLAAISVAFVGRRSGTQQGAN